MLPHLAEDGWENLPFPVHLPSAPGSTSLSAEGEGAKGETAGSVFQALWPQVPQVWGQLAATEGAKWATLLQVRSIPDTVQCSTALCDTVQHTTAQYNTVQFCTLQ